MKTKCGDKFVMCHTCNEKIRMNECGKEGNWIVVSSAYDLFKLNIDYQLLFINRDVLIVEEALVSANTLLLI